MIWKETARQAVAHLRKKPSGSAELARVCGGVDPRFLDDALAPLVDAGKLMRINAFRNGAAEFDYRFSAIWVPVDGDFDLCRGGGIAPAAAVSPVASPAPGKLEARKPPASLPAHVTRPATREENVATGKTGGHVKAQRVALDRAFTQSPQSLGWAPALGPQPLITHPSQEIIMPASKPKTRATKAASPQFQLCAALLAHGDMSGDDLRKRVKLANPAAIHNGIYSAKKLGRVDKRADGSFHLTAAGKEWVSGAANLQNQQAARHTPRTRKAKAGSDERKRLGVAAVRNGAPVTTEPIRSFRCAVFTDGSFQLSKGEQSIELSAVEHMAMLRYLERMVEAEA